MGSSENEGIHELSASCCENYAILDEVPGRTLSPPVSPPLGPVTYPSSQLAGPIVPRPREGHRRGFGDGDKQWILQEAAQPGASAAEVARRYGIAQRVLRRWKQELAAPVFVAVQITDADAPSVLAPTEGERAR
jgi:hypothetical protein